MEKSILLETIGDSIENRIIDFLIEGIGIDYSITDIADGCRISRPTVYKILPKLIKNKIVIPTRTIGRIQLYTLNKDNQKVKVLLKMEEMLLKGSFEEKQKIKVRT